MNYQHKDLANGRWFELSFPTQMANIGSKLFGQLAEKQE